MRKKNNTKRKEDILELRSQGKTYSEIQEELGCSKSTISYHCGKNKTEKQRVIKRNQTNQHKLSKKVSAFKSRITRNTFRGKIKTFKKRKRYRATHAYVNNISENFTVKDVLEKFGDNPACYLTGTPINLNEPETYHFDHITPTSKGGTNDLSNLGICTRSSNYAKNDLSVKEFHELCEQVLKWKKYIKTINSLDA